ncbi:MAG TPA: PQQ-dependent sugar dehydrogenase [Thermoanaerobaculia bacterium]|nr:PQQ-dependent sugar dehydrogenase [Thermoanaerobaculia bacterium]
MQRQNRSLPAFFGFSGFALGLSLLLLCGLPAGADPIPVSGPPRPVAVAPVLSGLDPVTSITNLGDSRLFLTLLPGRMVIVLNGQVVSPPFLDIHDRVSCCGEQGLLSAAFHPRFAENGYFFVDYTDVNGDTVIARYHVTLDAPNFAAASTEQILLHIPQPYANHNGGQLQFGPDGYLYIGMGDGGSAGDPACRAQSGDNLLGKLLRIDVDVLTPPFYGIPPSNPFHGSPFPAEAWAVGLRNPWRFSFDRQTGDLYIADVGQSNREEIDFQPAGSAGGQNYGWKVMEGNTCYSTQACPSTTPPCGSPAYTRPVLDYGHQEGECAVIGGYVYRGSAVPGLAGAYVFGDLCTGRLWSLARVGGQWQARDVPGQVPSLNTFGEDNRGEIYLATGDGKLFRLVAGSGGGPTPDSPGLFDPATATFHLKADDTQGTSATTFRFGPAPDHWVPIAGDWNGDGRTTVGLWDAAHSLFRLKNSAAGGAADLLVSVATASGPRPGPGALPLAGDWDGDGKTGVGLYDPATSTFYLKNNLTRPGFDLVLAFGSPGAGWLPIAGDWDGDGKAGIGLYDPERGLFFLKNTLTGENADLRFRFGVPAAGWLPLAGDWNGDGKAGVGLYDPATSTFHLRNTLSRGPDELGFRFGTAKAGWVPIAGRW